MSGASIEFRRVSKAFGDRRVLREVSLEIRAGETCVLLGPSGCGKTTLLRLVNRLEEADSGEVLFAGREVARWDPVALRRRIGYAIQSVGLLPHLPVRANVELVPRLLGWTRERRRARAIEMLRLVGLDPEDVGRRKPHQLSGGQRQRVGVARALAADPEALLLDEPFGAVDPIARGRLQSEFRSLSRRLGMTVLFVTHDVREAFRLADRITVVAEGVIQQVAPPAELRSAPASGIVEALVRGAETEPAP